MAEEPLSNFPPNEETGQPADFPEEKPSPFKGWVVFLFLAIIVIASFWVSFQLGKRLLIPVKNTSEQKIQAPVPETPPSIKALQQLQKAMSMEVTSKEAAVKAPKMAAPAKKEKIVHRERPKIQPVIATGFYKVQAGLYIDKEEAQKLADQVQAAGFEIYLKKVAAGWRVQVGAFRHKSEAEALQNDLSQKGFKSQIVYE